VAQSHAKTRPYSLRRRRGEDGTVPLELVIIAPVLVVLLAILVLAWRISEAGNQVTAAAAEAARAASLERDVSASRAAGVEAARRTLEDRGLACTDLDVNLDVSAYEPGGSVTATVSCTAKLSDLNVPGAPGSWTEEASFTEPIERYRGG
jgi:Flp pilus assembly protein TadG